MLTLQRGECKRYLKTWMPRRERKRGRKRKEKEKRGERGSCMIHPSALTCGLFLIDVSSYGFF